MTTQDDGLLPCPFCGAEAESHNDGSHGLGNILMEIRCSAPCEMLCSTGYGDEWEVRKKWNTRSATANEGWVGPPPTPEEVELMRKIRILSSNAQATLNGTILKHLESQPPRARGDG